VASEYRFAPALLVRFLGAVTALLGVLLLLVGILVAGTDLPGAVLTVTVAAAVAVVLAVGWLAVKGTPLVRFDEAGYRVILLRRAGVRQGRWPEVEDVVADTISGHDCVVLRLRDGRTTTIPVRVLDADPSSFLADLTARLDRGRGYRRLA
jgi:hypothetical protein